MAQILLWLYSLLHHEQVSVHFVHIADWEALPMDGLLCSISTLAYFSP